MFYNKFNDNDPYGDLRRKEEYERQRDVITSASTFAFIDLSDCQL